jgi:cytochrome c553
VKVLTDVKATADAREINDAKNIAAYIESQKNRSAEQRAEELFEMRAAFGAGEKVVNVITGEVTYL